LSSFSRSPSIILSTGTPVQRLTTAAMSSLGHFLAQHRVARLPWHRPAAFPAGDRHRTARPPWQIAAALRLFQFDPRGVELFLDPAFGRDLVALVLPAGGQFGRLLLEIGKLLAQRRQPVLRGLVAFLGERHFLDLELDDPPVEVLDFLGLASTSMRMRLAASSIRSIALSGRKRSAM
jgi:hypothetical protein